jgi:hypothetical protein
MNVAAALALRIAIASGWGSPSRTVVPGGDRAEIGRERRDRQVAGDAFAGQVDAGDVWIIGVADHEVPGEVADRHRREADRDGDGLVRRERRGRGAHQREAAAIDGDRRERGRGGRGVAQRHDLDRGTRRMAERGLISESRKLCAGAGRLDRLPLSCSNGAEARAEDVGNSHELVAAAGAQRRARWIERRATSSVLTRASQWRA